MKNKMVSKYPSLHKVHISYKGMLISETTSVLFVGYILLVGGYTEIFCLSVRYSIKSHLDDIPARRPQVNCKVTSQEPLKA